MHKATGAHHRRSRRQRSPPSDLRALVEKRGALDDYGSLANVAGLSKLMVCDRTGVHRKVQDLASFELGVTRTLVKAAAALRLTAVGIGHT